MKLNIPRERYEKNIEKEGNFEVGAGRPDLYVIPKGALIVYDTKEVKG
jgi:hypothetical protein